MNRPPLRTLRTAAALLSALALPASAKTYYVNALCGDDANTGLKPGLAFATLQRAADKPQARRSSSRPASTRRSRRRKN